MSPTESIASQPHPVNLDAAKTSLRRSANERLEPDEIPAEVRYWGSHRALLLGDLAARDFTDADETTLRNGIAFAELRLTELERLADRHLRARGQPGYPPAPIREDLGPRFAAAKWADTVTVIETLTAQAARKTGGGRYRVRCPFHEDRDPSLVIYEAGRGWHCFVCDLGGDAVSFVSELNHCTAVEALRVVEELTDTAPAVWANAS